MTNEFPGQDEQGNNIFQDMPEGVNVLDVILENPNFGKKTEDKWEFKRLGTFIRIRSIEPDEYESAVADSMVMRRIQKGSPQTRSEQDMNKFKFRILELGVIEPNFRDPETRRKISAKRWGNDRNNTVEDAIKAVFNPGEIERLSIAIMDLSGFGDDEAVIDALKGR